MAKSILDLYKGSAIDKEITDFSISSGINSENPTSSDAKTPISKGIGNGPTDKDINKKINLGSVYSASPRITSIEQGRGGKLGGALGSYKGTLKGSSTNLKPGSGNIYSHKVKFD